MCGRLCDAVGRASAALPPTRDPSDPIGAGTPGAAPRWVDKARRRHPRRVAESGRQIDAFQSRMDLDFALGFHGRAEEHGVRRLGDRQLVAWSSLASGTQVLGVL